MAANLNMGKSYIKRFSNPLVMAIIRASLGNMQPSYAYIGISNAS